MVSKYNNYMTDTEKELVLQMYHEGYNTVQIGKHLGRSDSSIGRFLKKNNLKALYTQTGLLNRDKEQIIEMYSKGMTAKQILPLFIDKVKSENTIISVVKQAGINRRNGVPTHGDINYFEKIDTEAKAYFLGLFLADGNVHRLKRNTEQYVIQITLKAEDKYMLEKFKQEIQSSNQLRVSKDKMQYGFSISSVKMAHDLIDKGVIPCKSLKAELYYNIPSELFRHYIRGLFDGNGTVYMYGKKLRFGLYGTHKIVTQFQDWLIEQIDITKHKIFDKKNVSFTVYQKMKDVEGFYNLIYKDATIYLKRKKILFDNYLNANM